MMPADYDEDDPARSSGDPMAEFHAERPVIDHESYEDKLNEQKVGDRNRLRSDTSDEEFLDTLSYCSAALMHAGEKRMHADCFKRPVCRSCS